MKYVQIFLCLLSVPLFTSCEETTVKVQRESGFEAFVENYNRNIEEWLLEEQEDIDKQEKILTKELQAASTETEKKAKQSRLKELVKLREKYAYRQGLNGYFDFKEPSDIPQDLVWENGMENPIIGDSRAKKGGVFHTWMLTFPKTLRPFGKNSNGSFRGELYDQIDMGFVGYHPITDKPIPALASEWARGADGHTMFFKLDPDATYSDGVKIKASDFMFYIYIRISDNVINPFQKQYFKEQFANITTYGDSMISVSLPSPKPKLPYYCNISPSAPHFYSEYGPDYKDRYQWRVAPTTGAYTVHPEDIKKGRNVTLSRVKDWWAKDKKFYKYSHNVDKISYQVIAEKSKAFELFLIGDLDTFVLGSPDYWYEKMEVPQYFNGYIEKVQFYNDFPRVPRGIYLNIHQEPLNDLNVRLGLAHAMDFKKVNTILFRGDAERLRHCGEGFGMFSNPNIEPREYSVSKAEEYFAKAGYASRDSDGYLVNAKGARLQLEITWGRVPIYDQMMDKLKEGAKKAGVEILLDGQQISVAFPKMLEKKHQSAFSGWNVQPPFPRYYGLYHSSNAYDEKGNVKPQTTNFNSYSNPVMDKLCEDIRAATNVESLRKDAWAVQKLVHDDALFIPALKSAYVRMGNWKWVQWPQTNLYEFCVPNVYLPTESYLYWIDEDLKKKILAAKKTGEKLPETNHFFDLYRKGIPKLEELEKRSINQN
ncbi:MAG: ABC transporter substrate-binding protein [Rubritalea sp.]|uniref:ABC transporter substrate-binding protein n=1 Tax=Rubritalea sp. TaxID=2109375 RepID=UPI0032428C6C